MNKNWVTRCNHSLLFQDNLMLSKIHCKLTFENKLEIKYSNWLSLPLIDDKNLYDQWHLELWRSQGRLRLSTFANFVKLIFEVWVQILFHFIYFKDKKKPSYVKLIIWNSMGCLILLSLCNGVGKEKFGFLYSHDFMKVNIWILENSSKSFSLKFRKSLMLEVCEFS